MHPAPGIRIGSPIRLPPAASISASFAWTSLVKRYATAGKDGVCDWKTPPGPAPGSKVTYCGMVGKAPQPNRSVKKRAAAAPSAAYISRWQIAPAGGLGLDATGIGMGGVPRAMAESVRP